jgi:hypothetical protein
MTCVLNTRPSLLRDDGGALRMAWVLNARPFLLKDYGRALRMA